jgi:hypothetical protein
MTLLLKKVHVIGDASDVTCFILQSCYHLKRSVWKDLALHAKKGRRNQRGCCEHVVLDLIDWKVQCACKEDSFLLQQSIINHHCLRAKALDELNQT